MSLYSSILPLLTRELHDPFEHVLPAPITPAITVYGIRPRRQTSTADSRSIADLQSDPNKFQVVLNVKHFKPEELDVKVVDNNFVVVHGKHEEMADEHGFISREFTRRYAVPDDVLLEKMRSSLSKDGILTIQAPKKILQPPPENERVIPIKLQQPASVEQVRAQQEQQQLKHQEVLKMAPKVGDQKQEKMEE